MKRTALIDTEFTKNGEVRLSDITILKVYNAGETVVNIQGLPIYPNQKEIIIPADGTVSNVVLNVEFEKKETVYVYGDVTDLADNILSSGYALKGVTIEQIVSVLMTFDLSIDFYFQLSKVNIFNFPLNADLKKIFRNPNIIEKNFLNKVVFIYKHII